MINEWQEQNLKEREQETAMDIIIITPLVNSWALTDVL
jgi:hypothetical protein